MTPAKTIPQYFYSVCIALFISLLFTLTATAFPPAQTSRSLDLNGEWQMQKATAEDAPPTADAWKTMKIPGQAPGDFPAVWLERTVQTPADWPASRFLLRCQLLEQSAIVFIDGVKAGTFTPPGDCLDLTDFIKPAKKQTLRLFIQRDTRQRLRGVFEHAGSGTLGITGSLRLDAVAPQAALIDAFLMPSFRQKALNVQLDFYSAQAQTNLTLRAKIVGPNGKPVHEFTAAIPALPAGESTQPVTFPWKDPILWELDRPYLYTITLTVAAKDGTLLDSWGPQPFGFREFWIEGREMFLNGHPCRFHLLWHWGVADNNIPFFQALGFNTVEIQPRNRPWFTGWGAHDEIDALAPTLDRHGMALIAPLKSIEGFDSRETDPRVDEYYARGTRMEISRYKNHPSILVWNLGMNICVPQAHSMPPLIGQALTPEEQSVPTFSLLAHASTIVQKIDPTRTVTSHADGNTTPFASANMYLNLIPMQEREEWLSVWGATGKKPFAAVEFGPPYFANFWHKGAPDPQYTEYCAIYLGDEAYRLEGSDYVTRVQDMTLSNPSGHGGNTFYKLGGPSEINIAGTQTGFFPVVTEYVRRTNRAWRTFGQNGGNHPWMWNVGFGGERSGPMGCFFYTHLKGTDEELRRRPDWANPYYDVFHETQQPLLVYLAGSAERFTAKDHTFFPGEKIDKQIIALWDSGWPTSVTTEWEATLASTRIAGDTLKLPLAAAEIRKVPISFTVPKDASRSSGEIRLKVTQDGKDFSTDTFKFQILPPPEAIKKASLLLWDPANESTWVTQFATPTPWKPGQPLNPTDTLIIGRNALTSAESLPFTANDLTRGLKVIILEQQRATLLRFGFRAEETFSRRLYPRQPNHPLLRGLETSVLADWRGSATLLPDQLPLDLNIARPRCMHWGNYGIVASVVIEVPHHGNFSSIVDGEFDMRYSPLLEWPCGAGSILFSQFDLTARVGKDPAATLLARNLLDYAATPANRPAIYLGGPRGRTFAQKLQLNIDLNGSLKNLPPTGVVLLGEISNDDAPATKTALDLFVKAGGAVLSLPKSPDEFNALLPFTVQTQPQKASRVTDIKSLLDAVGHGLGPADFHWRDFAEFQLFTNKNLPENARILGHGFFLKYKQGPGTWLLSQVDPRPFDDAVAGKISLLAEWPEPGYSNDGGRKIDLPKPWLRLTRQRIERLYSQLLSNLGVQSSPTLVRRLMTFVPDAQLQAPTAWQVTGPIPYSDKPAAPEPEWTAANPDQKSPVAWQDAPGGWSPKIPYQTNDFGTAYYARTIINSNLDHEIEIPIRYKLSFHTTGTIWFNDQRLARLDPNRWCPRLATESIVKLQPGRNEILIKCGRTEAQIAFQPPPDKRLPADCIEILYRDPIRFGDDPYAWFPW